MQPMKYVLDYADYTAPTRQHELDHTDQECIYWYLSALIGLDHEVGVGHPSHV